MQVSPAGAGSHPTPHDLRALTVSGRADDFATRPRPTRDDYGDVLVTHDNRAELGGRVDVRI